MALGRLGATRRGVDDGTKESWREGKKARRKRPHASNEAGGVTAVTLETGLSGTMFRHEGATLTSGLAHAKFGK